METSFRDNMGIEAFMNEKRTEDNPVESQYLSGDESVFFNVWTWL